MKILHGEFILTSFLSLLTPPSSGGFCPFLNYYH